MKKMLPMVTKGKHFCQYSTQFSLAENMLKKNERFFEAHFLEIFFDYVYLCISAEIQGITALSVFKDVIIS